MNEMFDPDFVPESTAEDVLIGILSAPDGTEAKQWLWLVEARLQDGMLISSAHRGFALSPPGESGFMVMAPLPETDISGRLLDRMNGYLLISLTDKTVQCVADDEGEHERLEAGLALFAEELGHDFASFAQQSDDLWLEASEHKLNAIARDLSCRELGPEELRAVLVNKLDMLREREEAVLIARDEAMEPALLGSSTGANDNLPEPQICTEPPEFDELPLASGQ
jgi:hypothetical protein